MNTRSYESFLEAKGITKDAKKNEPYSYIALDKMYRTFLLRWTTLDLHQKKK